MYGLIGKMEDAIEQTGAVLMGRRTFEMGDPDSYVGNHEFQVPIFVLTHHPPSVAPKQDEHLTFTFVTDRVESISTLMCFGRFARRGPTRRSPHASASSTCGVSSAVAMTPVGRACSRSWQRRRIGGL